MSPPPFVQSVAQSQIATVAKGNASTGMAVVNGDVFVATSALLGTVGQNQVFQWPNPYNPSEGPTAFLIPPTNNSAVAWLTYDQTRNVLYVGCPLGTNGVPHATATIWALNLGTGVASTLANATDLGFNPSVAGTSARTCTDGTNVYGTLSSGTGNSSLFSLSCVDGSLVGTVTLPSTPLGNATSVMGGVVLASPGNLLFWGKRWVGICTTAFGSVTVADVPTIGTNVTVGATAAVGAGSFWIGMRDINAGIGYLVMTATDLSTITPVPLPAPLGTIGLNWDGATAWGMDTLAHAVQFDASGNIIRRDDRLASLGLTGFPTTDAILNGFGLVGASGNPNAIVATSTIAATNSTRVAVAPFGDPSEKPLMIGRVMAAR